MLLFFIELILHFNTNCYIFLSNRSIFCKFVCHYIVQPQNSYPNPMYSKIRFPPSNMQHLNKKVLTYSKKFHCAVI